MVGLPWIKASRAAHRRHSMQPKGSSHQVGWLPERLTIREIARYWAPDDRDYRSTLVREIQEACIRGELLCEGDPNPRSIETYYYHQWMERSYTNTRRLSGLDATIDRDDFGEWLQEKGAWPLPQEIPLSVWFKTDKDHNAIGTPEPDEQSESDEIKDEVKEFYKTLVKDRRISITKDDPEAISKIALSILGSQPERFPNLSDDVVGDPFMYESSLGNHSKEIPRKLRAAILKKET
jgi:hypothetical protein